MSEHVTGLNRDQTALFPNTLDEYVDKENPVRFIDAFVDSLNLKTLGFRHAKPFCEALSDQGLRTDLLWTEARSRLLYVRRKSSYSSFWLPFSPDCGVRMSMHEGALKAERWRAKFIVAELSLPTGRVAGPSWLSFEKVDDSRVRASVDITVSPSTEAPVDKARKELANFLSLYNILARGSARIETDEGASRVTGTGFLNSVSGPITIRLKPTVSEEQRVALLTDATALFRDNEEILDRSEYLHLRLAIDYYNYGKSSTQPEESLVNWMIALEALYSDPAGELRHKLSVRAAWMLGESPQERLEIAKRMRELYDLRSKIVHGGRPRVGDNDIQTIESYVRDSIIRLLKRRDKPTKKRILQELDEMALGLPRAAG